MIYRWLMAAVATVATAVATGCCGMYPCGYGVACNDAVCGMGAVGIEPSCCDGSGCDSCASSATVGAGCGFCAGGSEPCGACGTGTGVGQCAQGFLGFARQSLHNALTCGSGCGELYIDEWYSDPPDAHDPCVDCARANTAPAGCGTNCWAPWNIWGRRFQSGDCQSCGESYAAEYTQPVQYAEPAVQQHSGSCPGGCGSLATRLLGAPVSSRTTAGHTGRPAHRIAQMPTQASYPAQAGYHAGY